MTGFRLALGFLTGLPVRPRRALRAGELGAAAVWFPAVGLLIGGLLWLAYSLLARHFPPIVTASSVVALWAILTGGLHLDGLGDCCDGLFASASAERRLEILRDVHVGAFGVVGLSLFLIAKTVSMASLIDPKVFVLAPVVGRAWMPVLAWGRPARADGLGARLHAELGWRGLVPVAMALAIAVACGVRGGAALIVSGLTVLGWVLLARARLGGHTGDVLGAACELAELSCLLVYTWGGAG